jgi:V/A-type H+-transporting ATPase subunit D
MAEKIRLELKRQREDLSRFRNYLPTLKLKKQQLQGEIQRTRMAWDDAVAQRDKVLGEVRTWCALLGEETAAPVEDLARVRELTVGRRNVAGLELEVFRGITFEDATYSLFSTPPWVDRATDTLRALVTWRERIRLLADQHRRLAAELRKVTQRVNLFEKVKIPQARHNIRVVTIYLGDQQTAAVGRAKIAKSKLEVAEAEGDLSP